MSGKVTEKERNERFLFLLFEEWEIIRRRPTYKADFKRYIVRRNNGKKKYSIKGNPVAVLQRFHDKYHIPPTDPTLSFNEILEDWCKKIKPGYPIQPFPLESLYRVGYGNFPIYTTKGTFHPNGLTVHINRNASISDVLAAVRSILENRNVKGTKASSSLPPLLTSPDILSDGSFSFQVNLESTKTNILAKIKNFLREKGCRDTVRKGDIKTFGRQLKVYDWIKCHPGKSFIQAGQDLYALYPKNKTPSERGKLCAADYQKACLLIKSSKKKARKRQLKSYEPKLFSIGIDYTKSEEIREKERLGRPLSRKKPNLWNSSEQYAPSPCKTYDLKEYSQEF